MVIRRKALFNRALAPFSARRRAERMARFVRRMGLAGGERIVDLGGLGQTWAGVAQPLDITLVNLPGLAAKGRLPEQHRFTLLDGDACALPDLADGSFDIVFSNSVIEHVGPPDRQRAFAAEARRLAPRYWVQTPSIWFPLEPHTGMPFWWFYPEALRARIVERWRRKLPAWAEAMAETRVIRRRALEAMFPEAELWVERYAGIAKSYVAIRDGS